MPNLHRSVMPDVIEENISLKAFNTFKFEAKARYFAIIHTLDELCDALQWGNSQGITIKILGEGSNLLLTDNIDALILVNRLKGLTLDEQDDHYIFTAAAGENWHEAVTYTVSNDLGGLENLALIPGTVGASPVQNIGAYGVEVKDCITAVEVIDRETLATQWLSTKACCFNYRDSRFKQDWANKYIILAVRFVLSKQHVIRSHYAGLKQLLPDNPTIQHVYDAVCKTRAAKLPDPKLIGNAGSFFKNPIVDQKQYELIIQNTPDLVAFSVGDKWKLAAGWLIDQAGWKGHRQDGVGVYEKQALCLVNHNTEDGQRLLKLEADIKTDILKKYGVALEREPIHFSKT